MTDSTKWKSVMVRTETYELLRDIADKDPRTISGILTDLIKQEWEWHFDRESRRKDPERIEKRPDLDSRPRNPFLVTDPEDSEVDR